MNYKRTRFVMAILAVMAVLLLASCGGQEKPKPQASIEDISVKTAPQTAFTVGDAFSVQGGVLALSYDDGSTKDLSFTAEGVKVSAPDMNAPGSKTITVEYDGFTTTYMITVETKKYSITLNLNYEGAPAAQVLQAEAGTAAPRPADPVRAGYRFLGWFADPAGQTEFDFTAALQADTAVYARWSGIHTVTFNLNYPDAPDAVALEVDEGSPVQEAWAPATLREGYEFARWHTDAGEDTPYDFTASVDRDIVLYAHWTEIEAGSTLVSVTFDYNGTDAFQNRTVAVSSGSLLEKPQDPEVKGRKFTGWFTAAEGGEAFDFETPVSEDMTLYAGWDVEYYNVSFKYMIDGQETVLRTRKIEPGDRASAGSLPVVEGYKFVNQWFIDPEFTEPFDFQTEVKRDYTLWIQPLKEYRFETELTYIDHEKTGVGSSDNFSGLKLIFVDNGTAGSSNGYWVSGLYYNTAFLEFVVKADRDTTDALLQLRLSAEWADMYIAPEDTTFDGQNYYGFESSCAPALLDEETGDVRKDQKGYTLFDTEKIVRFDYAPIAITGAIPFSVSMVDKRPFTDYLVNEHFSLSEGWNVIRLTVRNNHAAYDGTMEATAPMMDCISIFTGSTLSWNPVVENLADPEKLNN
ncbi:MAG: InlB B-repeat-containing protein [Lachnospiraceae bacterium]|nr:InlB B-repeat-containing protein [Lachnospiraceae bacterium]